MNEIKAGIVVAAKLPISESTRKRNPHLFGAVGAVEANRPQRPTLPPLERNLQKPEGGAASFGFRITCVALRKRLVDGHDAVEYSFKPLTDAIAASLGFKNDADPRLHWEYAQVLTSGEQGVIVKIETRARQ